MYYSQYYTHGYYNGGRHNDVHGRDTGGSSYRTPFASSVIKAAAGKQCSNAGQWSIDAVISNRSAFALPHKLILSVSDQCEFACNMCTFHPGQLESKMKLDDWKKLVYDTYTAGAVYTLFGGEPFLYNEIDELISYMGSLGVQMNVVTNGYHLKEHLDVLRKNQCHIVLSIDGLREAHDTIRGRSGSFERIEDALSIIFDQFTEEQQRRVSVNSVLLPENACGVRKLIDYLYGIGITNVAFQHLQFFGEKERDATSRIWENYYVQPFENLMVPRKHYYFDKGVIEKLQAAVGEILEARSCYPDMGIYVFPELQAEELELYYGDSHGKLSSHSLCLNPWSSATISADGNISLCIDASIGNCKEQNFWSAWYGERAMKLRNMVRNHIFPVCTRCCNFYNSYLPA